ncbi:peptidase family C78-domain-containing protein [Endogone sp. FLAS-F59071]|nr:peptidase family C78-domain-containing protein [Endogone sp. FLAS-F59071]|eukprot:RUS17261.1 peptidase family C78-domain-containing protein [Endogone sp. FLAS-F59071]
MPSTECPICNIHIEGDDLVFTHHVNSHFPQSPPHASSPSPEEPRLAKEMMPCPVCDERVLDMEAHVASHFGVEEHVSLDDEEVDEKGGYFSGEKAKGKTGELDMVQCDFEHCREFVPLSDLQSHLDAHLAETIENERALELVHEEQHNFSLLKVERKELGPDAAAPDAKRPITNYSYEEQYAEVLRRSYEKGEIALEEYVTREEEIKVRNGGVYVMLEEKRRKAMTEAKELRRACKTEGLIPKLRYLFTQSHARASGPYSTRSALLCSPTAAHLVIDISDAGWGCGYRNCQMLMVHLAKLPGVAEAIGLAGKVPDVPGLQAVLEEAWRDGFDPAGAAELNHRVVKTCKWIGAPEVYFILTYLGVRCTLIDFHKPTGPNKSHDALFDWITAYYTPANTTLASTPTPSAFTTLTTPTVRITSRAPLYLQHQGHSRNCVGIETTASGARNLVVFDPSKRVWREVGAMDMAVLSSSSSSSSRGASGKENGESGKGKRRNGPGFAGLSFAPPTSPDRLLGPYRASSKSVTRHAQYQIVALGDWDREGRPVGAEGKEEAEWLVLGEEERAERRVPRSLRVP